MIARVGRQILVQGGGHHGQDGVVRVVGHRVAQHIVPRVHCIRSKDLANDANCWRLLLTIIEVVVLEQTEDAQGQQEQTPHVEVVALATHRSGIGQWDQNATYSMANI